MVVRRQNPIHHPRRATTAVVFLKEKANRLESRVTPPPQKAAATKSKSRSPGEGRFAVSAALHYIQIQR